MVQCNVIQTLRINFPDAVQVMVLIFPELAKLLGKIVSIACIELLYKYFSDAVKD
jgi:hypothetical protein